MKRATGRVTLPEAFRRLLAGNLTPAEHSLLWSEEMRAWRGWYVVVGSLWASIEDAYQGADAEHAMYLAREHAKRMRPALLDGDWKTARLHALEAENILLRLRVALLEPFAVAHAKVQAPKGFHDHLRFLRALKLERARVSRFYGRAMSFEEALNWSARIEDDPRRATKWISEVMGKRPRGRPRR